MMHPITFRATSPDLMPEYKTLYSAGADLKAAESATLRPGETTIIRTGVFILGFREDAIAEYENRGRFLPELQIRARSSLAASGIILANGVGTIDIDYPGEIGVILHNTNNPYLNQRDNKGRIVGTAFEIKRGDRIAQLVIASVFQTAQFKRGGKRDGGFGSTGK